MGRFYDANEGAVVYFDSHSGDTHLLSEFAAHVMQQFDDQALTTKALVQQISSDIDVADLPELNGAVLSVLEELVSLDILKRE